MFDNPALIDVVNTAYSPDAEDIAWAHRVQAAKAEAPPNGLYLLRTIMIATYPHSF